jgi:hypothetical protein
MYLFAILSPNGFISHAKKTFRSMTALFIHSPKLSWFTLAAYLKCTGEWTVVWQCPHRFYPLS